LVQNPTMVVESQESIHNRRKTFNLFLGWKTLREKMCL
jgi:hypothetical protein